MADEIYVYGEEKLILMKKAYEKFVSYCKNNSRSIEFILAHKYLENVLRNIFKTELKRNLEDKLAIFSTDPVEEDEKFYVDIYVEHKDPLSGLWSDSYKIFGKCKEVKTELIDNKIKELNSQGIDSIAIMMNSSTYRSFRDFDLVDRDFDPVSLDDGDFVTPNYISKDKKIYPIYIFKSTRIADGYIEFCKIYSL